jgi:protein NrfC
VWNHENGVSSKCDLCLDTPYWDEKGGPEGKQACVEACPMMAIKMVHETPDQKETEGYDINLRNDNFLNLGLVEDSRIVPPIMKNQPQTQGAGARTRRATEEEG